MVVKTITAEVAPTIFTNIEVVVTQGAYLSVTALLRARQKLAGGAYHSPTLTLLPL